MQFILFCLFPLSSAMSGSHVTVTLGNFTYSHGDEMSFNKSSNLFSTQSHFPLSRGTFKTPSHSPLYYSNPVSYHPQAPVYHLAPVRYLHEPVVVSKSPQGPLNLKPLHSHHLQKQPTSQMSQKLNAHAYASETPFTSAVPSATPLNCSVEVEVTLAEVCTPSLMSSCKQEEMLMKTVTDKEKCISVSSKVCSVMEEQREMEVCVYSYHMRDDQAVATMYTLEWEENCMKNEEMCYMMPRVMPMKQMVNLSYPHPVLDCMVKTISLPSIQCEDVKEEHCFMVPDIQDSVVMMEKCETVMGEPACQMIEVSLPKKVCMEMSFDDSSALPMETHQLNMEAQEMP